MTLDSSTIDFGDLSGFNMDFSNLPSVPTDSQSVASSPSSGINGFGFMSAGSDILGGIGSFIQSREIAGADEYNAQLALMQGKFNVDQIGLQEVEMLSTQKAMYAKAGVEMAGSPLDTALHTATNFEYDKQIANFNAQSAANMDRYKAEVAKNQGDFALGQSLLKGGMDIATLS